MGYHENHASTKTGTEVGKASERGMRCQAFKYKQRLDPGPGLRSRPREWFIV
jgi:hypothetical protein